MRAIISLRSCYSVVERRIAAVFAIAFSLSFTSYLVADHGLGFFEGHSDIGGPKRAGSAQFDDEKRNYSVTGGGANMWFTNDALHFVWKKMSGDLSIAATIDFIGKGLDPHRKACLIIRQNLDRDSAYADAALHGDGLTSLQYREVNGAFTREIQSNAAGPRQLRLEKRGKYVSMSIARQGEELHPAGGSFRLELQEPFYVGLGVCAHNDAQLETAVFSNVSVSTSATQASLEKGHLVSTLETVTIASKDRRVTWWTTNLIEAPNWSRDGSIIYFNSRGGIHQIPQAGGAEQRLTTSAARDDGPEFSADGKTVYFNSDRTGLMQVWRMNKEGSAQEQVTKDSWNNWFPHPSPDGKWLVFLSCDPSVVGIPKNRDIQLRLLSLADGKIDVLAKLLGGQGTLDAPSWSPDSRKLAFVSYQYER